MNYKSTYLLPLLLASVLSVNVLHSQWTAQTSFTSAKLEALWFTDAMTGFTSSGNLSQLYKTVNGGVTWTANGPYSSRDLWFVDANTAFASSTIASTSGTMKKTINGGATWTQITAPNTSSYLGVSAPSASNAYFINTEDKVIKTTNGGASVTSYTLPLTESASQVLTDIFFVNSTTGYVSAQGGQVFKTINSGASWTSLAMNAGGTALNSLYFFDALTGYVAGVGGKVLKTTDGGVTWIDKSMTGISSITAIKFFDMNVGLAVGLSGRIFRTSNGGDTWQEQTSGTTQHLWNVFFLNATSAVAVGDGGTILKNSNVLDQQEFVTKTSFSIAPNPVTDISVLSVQNISNLGTLELEIYDASGKLVKRDVIESEEYVLDKKHYGSGIYILQIKNGREVLETLKLIVQ